MKKSFGYLRIPGMLLCVTVSILIAQTLIVKVQSTNLRREPKFYAPTIAVLKAGTVLEQIGSQEGWMKVRTAAGTEGWIHGSAVDVKKFRLSALGKTPQAQASANEVALAGKGFNKQVEQQYRATHADVSFAWVDAMLKLKVSSEELRKFMMQGKLGEYGGAK